MTSTETATGQNCEPSTRTGFLIVDTESVPDGELLARVKYPGELLTPEAAIERARAEAREASISGSDFLPVTFQIPVAVCVIRVGTDFRLQKVTCLDAPHFRPLEVVKKFWLGVDHYEKTKLVTFNGRGFDLPLLELAAYRYGLSLRDHILHSRHRFNGNSLDLQEFFTNYGACRMVGGLNLLAKMIGMPGKLEVSGDKVLEMWRADQLQEINDYCLFDTLDTYFVFLRTRVLTGDLEYDQERALVADGRAFVEGLSAEIPALKTYLDAWPISEN
ncbi:MAG: 3'-5' exonuclease [Gemmataceae bacterium]